MIVCKYCGDQAIMIPGKWGYFHGKTASAYICPHGLDTKDCPENDWNCRDDHCIQPIEKELLI